MLRLISDVAPEAPSLPRLPKLLKPLNKEARPPLSPTEKIPKGEIRSSLRAANIDGVFSTFFGCVTAEVLLTNFLLQLGASNFEIGILTGIPLLANFLQPIGAYLSDRSYSRHWFILKTFVPSRLLWLFVLAGIGMFCTGLAPAHHLVLCTLAINLITHIFGALGSPSWASWMAVLVPVRLRGRYFALRNSFNHLTNLLCVPLLGYIVSTWGGGQVQGYGVILILAIIAGILSLLFQFFMVDVTPQIPSKKTAKTDETTGETLESEDQPTPSDYVALLKDTNFLIFVLFFGLWVFSFTLSNPFFNVYLLDNLGLDVGWVTLYTSLMAGASLLTLMYWGKLSDLIGNRPVLMIVVIMLSVIPLLWLGISSPTTLALWVWLPLLFFATGSSVAAIDLCANNIQVEISPVHKPSTYFAAAAASAGLGGAIGSTFGGFLAELPHFGGLPTLFALSAALRLATLLPLVFVQEPRGRNLKQLLLRNRA
ncbi:MFS transporter [Moorena producens JHB]|uniref:MFS transporter n=1 Tax=Moorena producens (strain JHB) TaxID=1454205 RepID=A0A1D9FYN7_MOOP1|nr:MFS transporter [Moorena producens]AOY80477.1 MFS transporter [Moorena producens JHB]